MASLLFVENIKQELIEQGINHELERVGLRLTGHPHILSCTYGGGCTSLSIFLTIGEESFLASAILRADSDERAPQAVELVNMGQRIAQMIVKRAKGEWSACSSNGRVRILACFN